MGYNHNYSQAVPFYDFTPKLVEDAMKPEVAPFCSSSEGDLHGMLFFQSHFLAEKTMDYIQGVLVKLRSFPKCKMLHNYA